MKTKWLRLERYCLLYTICQQRSVSFGIVLEVLEWFMDKGNIRHENRILYAEDGVDTWDLICGFAEEREAGQNGAEIICHYSLL